MPRSRVSLVQLFVKCLFSILESGGVPPRISKLYDARFYKQKNARKGRLLFYRNNSGSNVMIRLPSRLPSRTPLAVPPVE